MKGVSTIKCIDVSIIYSQNGNVDSVKALAHNTLLAMTENWRKFLDKRGISGAILADLSKAFDCILHDLLIAKLAAYGLDCQSLKIIDSFLFNRQQRTKINNAFSRYSKIIYEDPQGSILDPLLFNIYTQEVYFFRRNYFKTATLLYLTVEVVKGR